MAVETKILGNGGSYTAPEGGFVGRLHGKFTINYTNNSPTCTSSNVTISSLPQEVYTLLEDVDYVKKVVKSGPDIDYEELLYPGVPIQLKESWTLTINGGCPGSFILMGYIEDL